MTPTDYTTLATLIAVRGQLRHFAGRLLFSLTLLAMLVGLACGAWVVATGGAYRCFPPEVVVVDDVRLLEQAAMMYRVQEKGSCPRRVRDIVDAGLLHRDRRDPWGEAYDIDCPGRGAIPVVCSAGPDGRFDTVDDVCSDGE